MSIRVLAFAGLVTTLLSGCASAPPPPPSAAQSDSAAQAAAIADSNRSDETEQITLGNITYTDFGMRDLHGDDQKGLDTGDYYFKGTFLRANPGQQLKLTIRNVSQQDHNFSVPSQGIDIVVPPQGEERVAVNVQFPESGAVLFFCKLHADQGMNGQLIAGNLEPQVLGGSAVPSPGTSPVPSPSANPSPSPSPSAPN